MKGALFAAACFSCIAFAASPSVFSPQSVLSNVEKLGAHQLVASLTERQYDELLDRIGTGDSKWLRIVRPIASGTDAWTAEGLGIALAYALPRNPAGVLRIADPTERWLAGVIGIRRVCGVPFIEAIPRGYTPTAIAAVEDVTDPSLATAKAFCLASLKAAPDLPTLESGKLDPDLIPVANPEHVAEQIAKLGPDRFMRALGSSARDVLRDRISMGYGDWVVLAPLLAPAAEPGSPNGIGIELAYALLSNPEAVLRVVNTKNGGEGSSIGVAHVCGMSFANRAPVPRGYARKAITALATVSLPALQSAREQCLKALREKA